MILVQTRSARWAAVLWLACLACDDAKEPAKPDAGSGEPRDAGGGEDAGFDAGDDAAVDAGPDAGEDGSVPADPELETTQWRPMFDATLSEWYRYLPSLGRDNDPAGIFEIEDGVLHVLGIDPPAGDQEFGYIATRSDYGNYRFRFEQRWGTKKFAPRANVVRDSGLLYHMVGPDLVWPQSSEFQIQENDIGDLYLLGEVGATTLIDPNVSGKMFKEGGQQVVLRSDAVKKSATYESLTDWNTLELIATEREFVHIVNQKVNHRGWALEYKSGNAWNALQRGKIVLQAEGAEVFYRNAQLRPVGFVPSPTDAVVLFDGSNADAFRDSPSVLEGVLELPAGGGDLVSTEAFGDMRLHFEFRLAPTLDSTVADMQRPATIVYLQGAYGIVLADSFGRALSAQTSGAVGTVAPKVHEALPAEVWQSVDVVFRSARWSSDGRKLRPAHVTIVYNGSEIHRALSLADETAGGADEPSNGRGPLRFAAGDARVRFRNIWLRRL